MPKKITLTNRVAALENRFDSIESMLQKLIDANQPKAEAPKPEKKSSKKTSSSKKAQAKPEEKDEKQELIDELLLEFKPSFLNKDNECFSWGSYKNQRTAFCHCFIAKKLGKWGDALEVYGNCYHYIKKDDRK